MGKRKVLTEDLYGYQWISDPSVCPVTGSIAYVHTMIDKEKNNYRKHIHFITLDGSQGGQFTNGDKDEFPAWSPNGSELAFLRTTDKSRQLWIIPVYGGQAKQLTFVEHGIGSFNWSPDGNFIAFTTRVVEDQEHKAFVGQKERYQTHEQAQVFTLTNTKREGMGLWDGLHSHIFILDLKSLQIRQVTTGELDAVKPFWSPDGRQLSFLTDPDVNTFNDIFSLNPNGGNLIKWTDSTLSISQARYSPDGKRIICIGSDRLYGSATQNDLYFVSVEGGTLSRLTEMQDVQLGNLALSDMLAASASPSPLFSADGSFLYVLGSLHGNVQVYRVSMDGTYEETTRGDRNVYQYAITSDGRYLVAASSDPSNPGDLYRIDTHTNEELRLTKSNDELLQQLDISLPEPFWLGTSDGWNVQGWIMKPIGMEEGKKYPMILQIHGGPHALYANSYSHEFQTLTSQGCVVLYMNPRGSFGYGQTFAKACRGDFGGGDYQDLMDAVDHVLGTCDFVDETRLGVMGGSYGGFMTNWIVGHTNRFRAAVTDRSISNWLSFYGTSDIGISYTEGEIEGNPWDDVEKLWKHSPLAYVKHIETPLLILHGENDLRCPIEQAEQFYVALKRLDKRTQLVRFPKANHAMLRSGVPSLRLERLNQINGWFNNILP
ncbi:S9 family peptidase [Paenibacillus sp. WQ 127069]|uniref:S9 family peptidase n=1 Tax=Paenibacillus baimaensis TaxID=2982185 RepID=A0ABT2UIZ0_9BACL|nr:S9 family peptidase [Paenibacillus sp. WQ 127069]MCU6793614.1 S9 family peptidase [Paenibacillus sp. WQ 127069]